VNLPPIVPVVQRPEAIPYVYASEANWLLTCPLHVVFDHDRNVRRMRPNTASMLLGTAAHVALAALTSAKGRGFQVRSAAATREVAALAFDDALARECKRRDAQIAERGRVPGDSTEPPSALPFFTMTRARISRLADQRFGGRWLWPLPLIRDHSPHATSTLPPRVADIASEIPLRSRDGLVRGVADSIVRAADGPVIEEFKTGELTPDRVKEWSRQLIVYAKLYHDEYGFAPNVLRIVSLHGPTREIPYVEEEASAAVAEICAALSSLNQELAAGNSLDSLARPSAAACSYCSHRPWCEAYWSSKAPGAEGSDVEGVVVNVDGYEVDLQTDSGAELRVAFRDLRLTAPVGSVLRICGGRSRPDSHVRCDRSTTVWRTRS